MGDLLLVLWIPMQFDRPYVQRQLNSSHRTRRKVDDVRSFMTLIEAKSLRDEWPWHKTHVSIVSYLKTKNSQGDNGR
jgi:hypothetical protein